MKNYKTYVKENILNDDYDEESERRWEIRINDNTDSYWYYKHDAIDRIVDILSDESENQNIEEYTDDDGEELTRYEISDMLFDLDELEFYDKIDNIKLFVNYDNDIKLINLSDDDEIEFLEI